MHNRVEVHFESIALQDQRVRGRPDDDLLAVVQFESAIRVGPTGASPLVIGVPREAIASAVFSVDGSEPGT